MDWLVGFGLASLIAGAAYALRALTRGGMLAAVGLGTLVYGLGGLAWAVLLVAFFASSSLLSRLFSRRKVGLEAEYAKGGRRDAGQVLANGGIAGLAVVMQALWPQTDWGWWAFGGALAAANADTWATELGALSRSEPRLVTNGNPVPRGTSGAVSALGLLAAMAGALLIALLAAWLAPRGGVAGDVLRLALAGLGGSLVDSLLGATLQAIYRCPACKKLTERHPRHGCGAQTELARGWGWVSNDVVNWLCTLAGAVIGAVR